MTARRWSCLGLLLAAPLGLGLSAGCSAAEPAGSPPPPTPLASSGTPPPVAPPPAKPPPSERQQVLAVVREYFAASNALVARTDPSRLARVIALACPCRRQVRSIRRAQRDHRTITGTARIRALRPTLLSATEATVLADYDFSGGRLLDRSGRTVASNPARRSIHWQFVVRRTRGHWQIIQIDDAR